MTLALTHSEPHFLDAMKEEKYHFAYYVMDVILTYFNDDLHLYIRYLTFLYKCISLFIPILVSVRDS